MGNKGGKLSGGQKQRVGTVFYTGNVAFISNDYGAIDLPFLLCSTFFHEIKVIAIVLLENPKLLLLGKFECLSWV